MNQSSSNHGENRFLSIVLLSLQAVVFAVLAVKYWEESVFAIFCTVPAADDPTIVTISDYIAKALGE